MSKSKSGAYIISNNSVTLAYNNEVRTVNSSFSMFDRIIALLKEGRFDKALKLVDTNELIKDTLGKGAEIKHGQVYYDGKVINTYLSKKIIEFYKKNFDIKHLLKFLENVMKNPSKSAQEELYQFLEHGKMPITEDGCFLAYKYVRNDFKDCHTGTLDYTPGKTVEMPREKVCADRNITCASGLHFCSHDYLSGSSYDKVVILKINPADVVSIPVDYDNAKGRACKVYSMCEWHGDKREDELSEITLAKDKFETLKDSEVRKEERKEKLETLSDKVKGVKVPVLAKCPGCGKKIASAKSTFTSGHGKKCPYCGTVIKGKDIIK